MPTFPATNDVAYVDYCESLVQYVNTSDKDLLFIVGYGLGTQPICGGFDGDRIMASISNI
jgi:hypothetical protein